MSSETLRAQEFAVRILKSHLDKNRLAHTYLITGKQGSGHEDLALSFASALNCERGKVFEACDCASCHKIQERNHADVFWLGMDPKVRSIKIEEIRKAIDAASLKPYEGKWKVFILVEADRLTRDAANALLKTLEEPPAHTIFILLVESRAHVLETIQSRSFEVRLKEPGGTSALSLAASEISKSLGQKQWEDFFEDYQGKGRDELGALFDGLMAYFREELYKSSSDPGAAGEQEKCLQAVDFLVETKEALEANANQKLLLTRLAMQFRSLFGSRSVLK